MPHFELKPANLVSALVEQRIDLIRVTAADWNGETFDGSPFSHYDGSALQGVPTWLPQAMEQKRLRIREHSNTDYAVWEVMNDHGEYVLARPGDYIGKLGGPALEKTEYLQVMSSALGQALLRAIEQSLR